MKKLEGKVAVITGAGSGIGQATALLFARHGAQICSVSRTMSHAEATVDAIMKEGGQAIAVQADVSQRSYVESMSKRVMDAYGQVDILCNNAGIGHTGSILDCSEDEWDNVMAVNVKSMYLCCYFFLPHMLSRGEGNIINMASVLGMGGKPKK